MRYFVPCKINITEIIKNTFLENENYKKLNEDIKHVNYESILNKPICVNNQPIGVITEDGNSILWLDITPEFNKINDEWNLMALNINLPNKDGELSLGYRMGVKKEKSHTSFTWCGDDDR